MGIRNLMKHLWPLTVDACMLTVQSENENTFFISYKRRLRLIDRFIGLTRDLSL